MGRGGTQPYMALEKARRVLAHLSALSLGPARWWGFKTKKVIGKTYIRPQYNEFSSWKRKIQSVLWHVILTLFLDLSTEYSSYGMWAPGGKVLEAKWRGWVCLKPLLWARNGPCRAFMAMVSVNLPSNPMRWVLVHPFHWWGNWGSDQ